MSLLAPAMQFVRSDGAKIFLSVKSRVARLCRQRCAFPCHMPRASFFCLLAFVVAIPLRAASDAAGRRFAIPAGEALVSLKRVAQQAELEIVYSAAVVSHVRTRAVSGDYTPLEALERMVADTPLRIIQHPSTGIL